MNPECYTRGACVECGCRTTALQMCNKACEGGCYPPMMSKYDWDDAHVKHMTRNEYHEYVLELWSKDYTQDEEISVAKLRRKGMSERGSEWFIGKWISLCYRRKLHPLPDEGKWKAANDKIEDCALTFSVEDVKPPISGIISSCAPSFPLTTVNTTDAEMDKYINEIRELAKDRLEEIKGEHDLFPIFNDLEKTKSEILAGMSKGCGFDGEVVPVRPRWITEDGEFNVLIELKLFKDSDNPKEFLARRVEEYASCTYTKDNPKAFQRFKYICFMLNHSRSMGEMPNSWMIEERMEQDIIGGHSDISIDNTHPYIGLQADGVSTKYLYCDGVLEKMKAKINEYGKKLTEQSEGKIKKILEDAIDEDRMALAKVKAELIHEATKEDSTPSIIEEKQLSLTELNKILKDESSKIKKGYDNSKSESGIKFEAVENSDAIFYVVEIPAQYQGDVYKFYFNGTMEASVSSNTGRDAAQDFTKFFNYLHNNRHKMKAPSKFAKRKASPKKPKDEPKRIG